MFEEMQFDDPNYLDRQSEAQHAQGKRWSIVADTDAQEQATIGMR